MELNVAYSSDDYYVKHLLVSMISLLDQNKDFDSINIYIIDNGIGQDNVELLKKMASKYHAHLKFILFSNIENKVNTDGKFPRSGFGRLFLDDIIEKDVVLYLDCDSVINGSFMELFKMDISDYIAGAVQDTVSNYYKQSIGLKPTDVYFNSGFILFNLKKWREYEMQKKAIQMIERFKGSVPHHDQGVFNAICHNRIKRLHPKYNFQCPMFEYKFAELQEMNYGYYSEKELNEAKSDPIFIHFTEGFSNRPWRTRCTHPYKDLYTHYQSMTPFKGQLENAPINRNSLIMYRAYQHLPFPLYKAFSHIVGCLSRTKKRLLCR